MFHLLSYNIFIYICRYSKFKFIKRVVSQSITPQRAYNTSAMVYTDVRYTIFPRIVSPLSSFRSNYSIHEVKIAIMQKLYQNLHIFYLQKRIVSMETIRGNMVCAICILHRLPQLLQDPPCISRRATCKLINDL